MSKKKHPEHVNHERWLVSYADFITLLFAFFVVLFASGQSDKRKTVQLAQAMQTAFEHNGIFDPHSKTPPISDAPTATQQGAAAPLALPLPTAAAQEAEQRIEKEITQAIAAMEHQQGASSITVKPTHEGLVVSLREAGFFPSGSADLRPEAVATLTALARALPHQAMRIEGHTDDLPIHTAQFATNWELSTARAAAITRLLLQLHAADPAQVSAAGYAEFHPTASNETEAGRAQNRRVDIVLLSPVSEAKPAAQASKQAWQSSAAPLPSPTRPLP